MGMLTRRRLDGVRKRRMTRKPQKEIQEPSILKEKKNKLKM
jgi:hypothetical protein